jgi:hypothetical protein
LCSVSGDGDIEQCAEQLQQEEELQQEEDEDDISSELDELIRLQVCVYVCACVRSVAGWLSV